MKRILASVVFIVFAFSVNAQMTGGSVVTPSNGTVHFLYYTPPNYRSSGTGHPLIISLGGVGEQGDGSPADLQNLYSGGIPKKIKDGSNMVFTYTPSIAITDGFVVLAPQLPKTSGNWQNFYVDAMIDYGLTHFNIDPSRVFLTGYSLGGIGAWNYAASGLNINKLAGIVPISSNSSFSDFCTVANNKVALWAFQGAQDATFGGSTEHGYVTQINSCPGLIVPAVDTIVPDFVHGSAFWDNFVYSTSNNVLPTNVYQWMLKVKRGIDVNNQIPAPVIPLGSNITLTTPVKVKDFPLLDGSGSHDDDVLMDYLWESVSSPAGVNVSFPRALWPVTTLNAVSQSGNFALPIGTYNMRLRVKDYLTSVGSGSNAHTQFADLSVTVAYSTSGPSAGFSAPVTDAGGSRTIASNVTQVLQIPGNAYFYPCAQCGYNGYSWTQISGPSATLSDYNNPNLPYSAGSNYISFTNLNSPGTYQFRFSATSVHGEVGSDIFTIIKLGALPVTYSYFNGQNAGNKNTLSWATTEEVNSERFDVLRSTDGVNFSVIGTVASHGGAVLTQYTFDDNNAPAGLAYYRLSQVDKDGKSSLSKIISVSNRKTGLYIEKYPNPVHDNLTVTAQGNTNGTMQVVIADMQGKTILQQQWQKDLSLLKKTINVAALQKGVYQMIVTIGQEKQVSSFVKY
jgi:Secretion system C-terminal sorting domain